VALARATPAARSALALALALAAGAAAAQTPRPTIYRYEASESLNGTIQSAYRVDFELARDRRGGLEAIVLRAEAADHGGEFKPVTASETCRAAMHAPPGGLARVRLWPTAGDPAEPLGAAFLDLCAPDGVFFPLTDIVNVALIPISPRFEVRRLRRVGQTARFPAFTARFGRNGRQFEEVVAGGEVALVARAPGRDTVEWRPDAARLTIREPTPQGEMLLLGAEHWAFRVGFDPRSRLLASARAIYDDIDMTAQVPGLPADKAPRLKITRQVTIEALPPAA